MVKVYGSFRRRYKKGPALTGGPFNAQRGLLVNVAKISNGKAGLMQNLILFRLLVNCILLIHLHWVTSLLFTQH
jgi:hypothetical protein